MIKAFLKALRLPFLAGSIIPVITAAAFAFHRGSFSLLPLLIAIIGVGALHLGSNCINDYYDSKGSDPINIRLTPKGKRTINTVIKERQKLMVGIFRHFTPNERLSYLNIVKKMYGILTKRKR